MVRRRQVVPECRVFSDECNWRHVVGNQVRTEQHQLLGKVRDLAVLQVETFVLTPELVEKLRFVTGGAAFDPV
ncbi:hypothetical protein FIV00_11790 [Labrenzia sp. THAF82]|nr:hypothetical protein FIV00_11790 [Labrenzia sp. THAF82]